MQTASAVFGKLGKKELTVDAINTETLSWEVCMSTWLSLSLLLVGTCGRRGLFILLWPGDNEMGGGGFPIFLSKACCQWPSLITLSPTCPRFHCPSIAPETGDQVCNTRGPLENVEDAKGSKQWEEQRGLKRGVLRRQWVRGLEFPFCLLLLPSSTSSWLTRMAMWSNSLRGWEGSTLPS